MGVGEDWRRIAENVGLPYLLPDLAGHGGNAGQAVDFGSQARVLIKMLDDNGVSSCRAVGYSMGGRLALYLAIHYPERVSGLVLESASPGLQNEADRVARIASDEGWAARLEFDFFGDVLDAWFSQEVFISLRESPLLREIKTQRLSQDSKALARALHGFSLGRQASLWDQLGELAIPVLLISGEQDPKFRETMSQMALLISNSRHVIIDGAGHMPHVEEPELVAQLLKRFF